MGLQYSRLTIRDEFVEFTKCALPCASVHHLVPVGGWYIANLTVVRLSRDAAGGEERLACSSQDCAAHAVGPARLPGRASVLACQCRATVLLP